MGNDIVHRPDWTPAVSAGDTIAAGNWGVSAAAAVEIPADLSPALASDWAKSGGVPLRLAVAQGVANSVLASITEPDEFTAIIAELDALPEGAREAIISELSLGTTGAVRIASEAEIKRFSEDEDGGELVKEWRGAAPRKVAIVRQRLRRIFGNMSADDATAAATWFGELPAVTAQAVLRELAR